MIKFVFDPGVFDISNMPHDLAIEYRNMGVDGNGVVSIGFNEMNDYAVKISEILHRNFTDIDIVFQGDGVYRVRRHIDTQLDNVFKFDFRTFKNKSEFPVSLMPLIRSIRDIDTGVEVVVRGMVDAFKIALSHQQQRRFVYESADVNRIVNVVPEEGAVAPTTPGVTTTVLAAPAPGFRFAFEPDTICVEADAADALAFHNSQLAVPYPQMPPPPPVFDPAAEIQRMRMAATPPPPPPPPPTTATPARAGEMVFGGDDEDEDEDDVKMEPPTFSEPMLGPEINSEFMFGRASAATVRIADEIRGLEARLIECYRSLRGNHVMNDIKPKDFDKQIQRLRSRPDIERCGFYSNTFVVITKSITAEDENHVLRRVGRVCIKIPVDIFMRKTTDIRVMNLDHTIAGQQAPHIDMDGKACWGAAALALVDAVSAMDLEILVSIIIEFLHHPDTEDGAGETIKYYPEAI